MSVKIHFISDRHGDLRGNALTTADAPVLDAQLVLNSGDERAPGTLALHQFRASYPDPAIPLVYVAGNHDIYSEFDKHHPELKTTIERQAKEMPEVADRLGIILLQDSVHELEIDGMRLRIAGGTGWTGFDARPGYMSMNEAMRLAGKQMNDYRMGKVEPGRSRDMLTPVETLAMHRKTVRFLEGVIDTPFDGDATIFVTHHCPSYRSLRNWDPDRPENFGHLDWCYASNLEHLMLHPAAPDMWFHGHVHNNQDYGVGKTRVLANPRGYAPELGSKFRENPDYDPRKIVELEPRYSPSFRM